MEASLTTLLMKLSVWHCIICLWLSKWILGMITDDSAVISMWNYFYQLNFTKLLIIVWFGIINISLLDADLTVAAGARLLNLIFLISTSASPHLQDAVSSKLSFGSAATFSKFSCYRFIIHSTQNCWTHLNCFPELI